jgi:hypothetical protein
MGSTDTNVCYSDEAIMSSTNGSLFIHKERYHMNLLVDAMIETLYDSIVSRRLVHFSQPDSHSLVLDLMRKRRFTQFAFE